MSKEMHTIYLDMDGVIADFWSVYSVITGQDTPNKFRQVVTDYRIFETLPKMPYFDDIIYYLKIVQSTGINVEILGSLGTTNIKVSEEVKRQKQIWLNKHKVDFKQNFVLHKDLKAQHYSNKYAVLLDDTKSNIETFSALGGTGILYSVDFHFDSMKNLINTVDHITKTSLE